MKDNKAGKGDRASFTENTQAKGEICLTVMGEIC